MPRPPETGMAPGGPGPEEATRRSADFERERRVVMERVGRLEHMMQERDARMGKAARELSARIDRMEGVLKKSGPEAKVEPARPVPDERVKQATREMEEREVEARMKNLKEMEAKLGERARELQRMADTLGNRERELRQMEEKLKASAEKLETREMHLREVEKNTRKKADHKKKTE